MKKKIIVYIFMALLSVCLVSCDNSPMISPTPSEIVSQTEKSSTIKALYITPDGCTIKVGEKRTFTVQSDKGTEDVTDFLWTSDDNNIATVDFSGNLIGRSEGDCIITVSSKNQAGLNAKVMVKVKPDEQSSKAEPSVQSQPDTPSQPPVQESSTVPVITRQKNFYSYSNYEDAYEAYQLVSNYLSEDDIYGLTAHDAQLLINTIYAKHGYIFQDNEVKRFFESQYWYNSISNKTRNMNTVSAKIQNIDMDSVNLRILQSIQ